MWFHPIPFIPCSLLALIVLASSAHGESPTTLTSEKAKALVIRLGSTNDKERASAAKDLKALGATALIPVMRQVGEIKQEDVKLIAKLAACRVLAFDDPTDVKRLTSNDDKLKIKKEVLGALALGINSKDDSDQRVAAEALSLLCFTTNGTALDDIRTALKDCKPEQVEKLLQASIIMHAKSVISTVTLSAKPGPKVKMVQLDAYEDQLKAIARYGELSIEILDQLKTNADKAYKEWETASKAIALLGDDEQWHQCVATGSSYYTLQIAFGQLAKVMKEANP